MTNKRNYWSLRKQYLFILRIIHIIELCGSAKKKENLRDVNIELIGIDSYHFSLRVNALVCMKLECKKQHRFFKRVVTRVKFWEGQSLIFSCVLQHTGLGPGSGCNNRKPPQ